MKTTILLCALATIAAAVPTNHHEIQEEDIVHEHLPATIQRERKSPLHDHHATGLPHEAGTEDIQTEVTSKSGHKISPIEGRSFGFKKPIIVKKKIGYHVYRDSDEEMAHADPHENCRKQVKVKLCDDEPGSPKSIGNCFVSERLHKDTEKEIENDIKTAKEAVENLQRGFHKMEHSSAKLAKTEDKDLEDELALHQHIEAARKALEHVHRNFENMDSLNLQTTLPTEEQTKTSDEVRLAQWKEAIDNIQKNIEIARNIEDAFKVDSEQTDLKPTHHDESSKIRESEHTHLNVDDFHHKSSLTNFNNMEQLSDASNKQREDSDIDMYTAPTEQKELKVKLHSDSLRSETLTEEPSSHQDMKTTNSETPKEHMPMKKSSEITPLSDEPLKTESDNLENTKEIVDHLHNENSKAANHDKPDIVKSAHIDSFDQTPKLHEHDMAMGASHVHSHKTHLEMKHSVDNELDKSTHKEESLTSKMLTNEHSFDKSLKSKSALENDEHHKEERIDSTKHEHEFQERMNHAIPTPSQANTKHIEPTPIRETSFNNGQQNINENFMRMMENQNLEHKSNEMHRLNEKQITDMRMTEDQKYHEFLMRLASQNHQRVPESPLSLMDDLTKMGELNGQQFHDVQPSMRLSQNHNAEHHLLENHEENPSFNQWTHENHHNVPQLAKTAAEHHETMKMNQDHVADEHSAHDLFLMRLAQEKQQNEQLRFANNLAHAHDMSQLGPRMNEHLHLMKHTVPSDMDNSMQPSMHMSMREPMGKPPMEHKDTHWNHHHHHHHAMARYGSGLPVTGVNSGAVGLFPNANTGGCGIPLMLSCSPNVVSGTLAKAQSHSSTIGAPAYRSGDDMTYYIKRDAKDTDELPSLRIQKSSLPFNHKPELIFEKPQ